MPSALAATDQWPCRWRFAWTQPKTTLSFCFLRGSVATLFAWSWKILSYFVANLSKTLNISFYQNQSSIVEAMIKKCGVFFMPHSVRCRLPSAVAVARTIIDRRSRLVSPLTVRWRSSSLSLIISLTLLSFTHCTLPSTNIFPNHPIQVLRHCESYPG